MEFIKDEYYLELIKSTNIIKSKNLQQQIYKVLLNLITKGFLKSNTLLNENKISLAFNVSKTPVREALKRLESDELVRILPQSRTYILPIDTNRVNSAHKIREALEVLLVEEAINHVKENDFKVFEALIEKQQIALKEKNFDDFFEYDEAFHYQIAKSANLLDAWQILKKVNLHLNRVRCMTKDDYHWNSGVIEEHKSILKAIRKKDFEVAKLQMTLHLSRVSNVLTQILTIKEVHNDAK